MRRDAADMPYYHRTEGDKGKKKKGEKGEDPCAPLFFSLEVGEKPQT